MGIVKEERLQKIIARAGVTSRRKAEDLIRTGCVTVNGKVVTEMGSKADIKKDHIKVSGRLIRPNPAAVYLILHKPRGVVSTLSDPLKRKTVKDLIQRVPWRVFPVGRLDFDSEGLMLFTNDGDLFHRLLHPGFKVPKTYHVKVKGMLSNEEIRHLEEGVSIFGKKTLPCRIKKMTRVEKNSWLEVTLYEGRKRQIRRMIEKIRHRVQKLKRVRIGNLHLGTLPSGEYRFLTPPEIKALKALADRSEKKAPLITLSKKPTVRARGKTTRVKAWGKKAPMRARGKTAPVATRGRKASVKARGKTARVITRRKKAVGE